MYSFLRFFRALRRAFQKQRRNIKYRKTIYPVLSLIAFLFSSFASVANAQVTLNSTNVYAVWGSTAGTARNISTLNVTTGALSSPPFTSSRITATAAMAFDPNGSALYYSDRTTSPNNLIRYTSAGESASLGTFPGSDSNVPILRMGFRGTTGYAISSNNTIYTFTTGTPSTITNLGTVNFLGTSPSGTTASGDIAFDGYGRGWAIFGNSLYRLNMNVTPPEAIPIGQVSVGGTPLATSFITIGSIAFDSNGNLLIAGSLTAGGANVYRVSINDASAVQVGSTLVNISLPDLASGNFPLIDPQIQATKTVSPTGSVLPGATLTYTIEVENIGSAPAVNLDFIDPLPAGTTYVANSATLNGTNLNAATYPFASAYRITGRNASNGTLKVGNANRATLTFQVTVNTTNLPSSITNQGTIIYLDSPISGVSTTNATTTITSPVSGYKSVRLTTDADGSGTVTPGDTLTWTISYRNNSTAAVSNVQINDQLPTGLTTATGSQTVTVSGIGTSATRNSAYTGASAGAVSNLLNTGATLGASGVITVSIPTTVNSGFSGTLSNQANATGSSIPGSGTLTDNVDNTSSLPSGVTVPAGSITQIQNSTIDPTTATVVTPAVISISGTVWNDADNSANNTFSNIRTGSEPGTNAGGLNAILVNSAGNVIATTPIAANGTYTFNNITGNQSNVTIRLSTIAGTVGNTAPTASIPVGWTNTSPLTTAAFNISATNLTGRDFGIEQLPTTNPVSASPQINPGGTNTVQVPTLSGTDPEDGALGSGNNFKIVTLPSNGTLYYDGTQITTSNFVINAYDPARLRIDPNDGTLTVSFTYVAIDAAGKESLTPATVTMPFTAALVSISGTVFHDHSANVVFDNDLGNDIGTNAGSSSLTVYAVNFSGQVVDKATVAANGAYTLNVPPNSTVTLRLSNNASIAIGDPAPTAPSLPSGWYHTGENLNGTIDAVISTLGDMAITTATSALPNHNFGIRQGYVIAPDPAPTTCNPDYTGALTTGISSTGGQLSPGNFDLNWSVEWLNASLGAIPYAPARPVGPMPAVVVGNLAPGAWINEPSNARWISYPFRLSNNSNGNHQNADLDGIVGEIATPGSYTGTSDTIRLKYTASVTLPANANAISVSLPIGVSVDNQFVSVRVNGVENLSPLPAQDPQTEDYRATRTVNMTQGWQPGVNIIEIITDSGSPLTGFFLRVEAATIQVCASPNVSVVKRITAINGLTSTQGGDNLSLYKDEASNPYDDNTITIPTQPNPTDPPKDTDKWPNLSTFLVGGTNGGFTKPGDELEYTIYFLSAGDGEAQNVLFCDRVPTNVTFNPTAFNTGVPADPNGISTANRGIVVNVGGNSLALTGVADGDRARYFPPGVEPSLVPEFSGINCNGANTNGAVVVNLGNLNSATAPGVPADSYGFVRFRARVK